MLEAIDLACERGERRLFHGISFRLERGGLLRVLGPNGSGKTSLLRILCGLTRPIQGKLSWRGYPMLANRLRYLSEISYVGHFAALSDELTARENLAFYAAMAGIESKVLVGAALERLELTPQADLPAKSLSQGQRRRAGLARLLLQPAPVWILDEPFTALDDRAVAILQRLLGEHLAAGNMAIISTHQEVEIAARSVQRVRLGA